MKVLLRLVVILAAAVVVVGVTYVLDQNRILHVDPPPRAEQVGTRQPPTVVFGLGGREQRALGDVLHSLAIVIGIVLLYGLLKLVWRAARRKPPQHPLSPPHTSDATP